jgi:hypothetical protein
MRRSARLVVAALLLVAPTLPSWAQPGGGGASVKMRLGGFFPSGSSEFWEVNEEVFTLDHSDFDDFMFGGSWVTSLSNHVEVGFNVDFYDAVVLSAYRDFVDQDGFQILHDTALTLVPLTVDVRFLPGGRFAVRGARGERLVRKPVPYIGVGAGVNFWEYEEVGDFVGGIVPTVFFDRLTDDGVDPEAHALLGIELPVGPAWSFTVEGRYSWSEATPGGRFTELDQGKLDLGGFAFFGGAAVQF